MPATRHGGEDWRKRLRDATFRGAHFWVETDGIEGGRRIVIHEFPMKELPYNEDMGQQARRYNVDAYCVGGQADKEAQRLVQACTAPGPATLVLPLFGTIRARCVNIRSQREKDKQGYVSFQLDFVADDLSLAALGGSPHVASQVRSKVKDAHKTFSTALLANYDVVTSPSWVLESAVETAREFFATIAVTAEQSELRGDPLAEIQRAVQGLYDDAPELLAIGAQGNTFGMVSFMTTERVGSADPLTSGVQAVLDQYRASVPDPMLSATGLYDLSGFDVHGTIPKTTLNRKREAANRESLLSFFRRSALAQYAAAVMDQEYPSRRAAIGERARVVYRFNMELERITNPNEWEVVQAMRDLMGLTVEFLTRKMADLAPVLSIEARSVLPTLYWAYRLYGDPMRAQELWERNSIIHPMWVPTEFEALAR